MSNQPPPRKRKSSPRIFEWIFATGALLICFIVPALFTINQISIPSSSVRDILPFPALYFIEIASLGIACLVAVYRDDQNQKSAWNAVPWLCAGINFAFVILGAWTIGFFLIPSLIAFVFVGFLMDKRKKGDIALHFIYLISAGIAQSMVVLLAVSVA
jgi:hypothetical protein